MPDTDVRNGSGAGAVRRSQRRGGQGEAIVTARAPNTSPVTASVVMFGPPVIVPAGISITTSIGVTVTDPGGSDAFVTCVGTPGADLAFDPVSAGSAAGSAIAFTVIDGSAAGGSVATLTCSDQYGQISVATYTVPK